LLTVAELNPVDGLHESVAVASVVSPIAFPDEFSEQVFVNGLPALTVGTVVLTVTVTDACAVQPEAIEVLVTV
jgi:hypothetical protein